MVFFNFHSISSGFVSDYGKKPLGKHRLSFDIEIEGKVLKVYQLDSYVKIYDNKYLVGQIDLTKKLYPFPSYHINSASLNEEFIGHGIIKLIYNIFIVDYEIPIVGFSHSLGARKTWSRLSEEKNINSYAFCNHYTNRIEIYPARLTTKRYSAEMFPRKMISMVGTSAGNHLSILLVKANSKIDDYIKKLVKISQKHNEIYSEIKNYASSHRKNLILSNK